MQIRPLAVRIATSASLHRGLSVCPKTRGAVQLDFLAGDASDPKRKKSTEAPFVIYVPDVFTQAFVIEKDSKRFPKSGGWGYALFNYDAKNDTFSADADSKSDCGHACHLKVAKKDFIFHPYQKR